MSTLLVAHNSCSRFDLRVIALYLSWTTGLAFYWPYLAFYWPVTVPNVFTGMLIVLRNVRICYIFYILYIPYPSTLPKSPSQSWAPQGFYNLATVLGFILGSTDEAPPWLRPGFTAPDGSYVRHWSSIYASGRLWSWGLDSGDSAQQGRHPRLVWVEPGAAMLLLLCCYAALPLRQRRTFLNSIFSISLQYNISYLKISMPWGLNLGPLIRNV